MPSHFSPPRFSMPRCLPPGRSRYDREIFLLALPALGALAAEPLYLLTDTAIVGHLGTIQLASLALASAALDGLVTVCNFLTYGTTAHVARLHGAGQAQRTADLGRQALWLALGIGVVLLVLTIALAGPAMDLLGGGRDIHVTHQATRYLRISALGIPSALLALAGQGYLRGISSMRIPLLVVVGANALNLILELLFVYGLGWGLDGSAWGTVIAQTGMGGAFWVLLGRQRPAGGPGWRPRWSTMAPLMRTGGWIALRTASLLAAFTTASAVLARVGASTLGAHQVVMALFFFLALALDSIAIAGQVIVGRRLGAEDAGGARDAARRMIEWSLAVGLALAVVLLGLTDALPKLFSGDGAVLARVHAVWPLFAAVAPAAAVVFALDGILLGAGDARFLAGSMALSAVCVYVPIALASLHFGWGIVGVWAGLLALIAARLTTCGLRFASGRWAVLGAVAR